MAKKKNMFGTSEDVGALSSKDLANISQINQPTTTNGLAPITGITNVNQPKITQTPNEQPSPNQVFRNETGKPSGITVGGKTFLGLNPRDVEKIAAGEQAKKGGVATQAFEQEILAQQEQAQAMQAAQAAQGIGLTPEQIFAAQSQATEQPIDIGQALTAGTIKNAPSLIGNIAGGAAAGAVIGAPIGGVGAVPGAVIGGIGGAIKSIWGGVQSNIASQQKGEISAAVDVLSNSKTNMKKLSTLASKDPANAAQYVEAYNQQLALAYRAQQKIKLETQGNLNKFIEDGTEILSDFELFLMPNGQAELYGRQLQIALAKGVAPEFSVEDLTISE